MPLSDEKAIHDRLTALADPAYRDFSAALMPTVEKSRVLGVRTPLLRALAREMTADEARAFRAALPHRDYEENNLHALTIMRMKDYPACLAEIERFLPYIDNWATCDTLRPPVFKKHLDELLPEIRRWMASDQPYTARFGIETLMAFYLDGAFTPDMPALVARVDAGHYYVHMMIAWYFATALAKQYDAALPCLENRLLDAKTQNKAIQKAVESYRIPPERKAYLKTLKR